MEINILEITEHLVNAIDRLTDKVQELNHGVDMSEIRVELGMAREKAELLNEHCPSLTTYDPPGEPA